MSKKGGLAFIANQQLPDGGFLAYDIANPVKSYRTTFVPSLIALALHEVPGSKLIQKRIAEFLIAQKNADWSWNYWDRNSAHASENPYPDDLDDTVLALAHLWHYDKTLFTPEVMARIVSLLFVTETQPGGPYVTWVADETADKAWRDIDVIVNGNIAAFLALQDVSLPLVNEFIERAIIKNELTSPYYPGLLPGAYLIARWYGGGQAKKLQELILAQRKNGIWKNPHQTALAISALLRLGYPVSELQGSAGYLKQTQQADGGWDFGAMYIVDVEYGARTLTTALCLEALFLYEHTSQLLSVARPVSSDRDDDPTYDALVSRVQSTIEALPQADLRAHTSEVLERILGRDADRQIVLLPRLVEKAAGLHIAPEVIQSLSAVSLWGWMAYTELDDFLDQDGDPKSLPSAVFAHRRMCMAVREVLISNHEFQAEATEILDRLDGANAWEVCHCRGAIRNGWLFIDNLPDYGDLWQLADRSLGHIIAAIGVLYAGGFAPASAELTGFREFFRNYLIARQLNDDAHDWQDDLALGHVNAVAVLVLKKWRRRRRRSLRHGINLENQADVLRLIMWEEVVQEVCKMIEGYIEAAKKALLGIPSFDSAPFFELLQPLERSFEEALRTRDQALKFISKL